MEGVRETREDRWGYPVRTTSNACITAINSYYHQVLTYGRDRAVILDASGSDPNCVLANTLAANFLFNHNPSKALAHLQIASSLLVALEDASCYEKAVFRSISCLMDEEVDDDVSIESHFEVLKDFPKDLVLKDFPKDLVCLKRAQVLCFYMGQPLLSLKFAQQVLPYNEHQSYMYGMLAFPLLELGRMDEAEEAAKRGLQIESNDFWSQHALCHVLQNNCYFKEAVDFMEACSPSWMSCSPFMFSHNWWHVAVCYLEGHAPLEKVLHVYDYSVMKGLDRKDGTSEYHAVYVDALGLLLRFFVRGYLSVVDGRLRNLANVFTNQCHWHVEWLLDLLALWALNVADETQRANDLLCSMKSRLGKGRESKQLAMQKGIKLAEALHEYGRGSYEMVYHLLGPEFDAFHYKMIGASDEQIDIFNEVWYVVLLNTGRSSDAIREIQKRINQREGVPFLWQLLEKAYCMEGTQFESESSLAADKAKLLQTSYFKQTNEETINQFNG